MKKENGEEMSEKELIDMGSKMLSSACFYLFQIKSKESKALAWMVDSCCSYAYEMMGLEIIKIHKSE